MPNLDNGNNILTHDSVAKAAAPMLIDNSCFVKHINRKRETEFNKVKAGYKEGDDVRIKVPPRPQTQDGHVFDTDLAKLNAKEEEIRFTIDKQTHTPLKFGAAERALDLRNFKQDFLKPATEALAIDVDVDILSRACNMVNNTLVYSTSSNNPLAPFGKVRGMLQRALAPKDRWAFIDSDSQNSIIDPSGTLFNPQAEISKQFKEGFMGRARGVNFKECEHLPLFTNGRTSAITVNGASQTGNTLTVTGLTNGDVIEAGQTFTIQGVEQLHPTSHQSYKRLQQFAVLERVEAGGATATLKIFPKITPKMVASAKQANPTVSASPANSAPLVFTGKENTTYRQSLICTNDAFSIAFVPLEKHPGTEGYNFNGGNMSMRFMSFGDGVKDFTGHRLDVLYGFGAIRANHAARVLFEV